jgi:hypothetical protein
MEPPFSVIFKNDVGGFAMRAAKVQIDYFSAKYNIPSFE